VRLRDVRTGDRIIEHDCGCDVLLEATEDAHEVKQRRRGRFGYECRTRVIKGHAGMADKRGIVMLFECHDPGGYGLNLYPANAGVEPRRDSDVGSDPLLALREELRVTDALLEERQRVLDAIPECPCHGPCVPHALEWIEKAKKIMQANAGGQHER